MPVEYLPITITLHEDAVLPDSAQAGNATMSVPWLTGRALRGAISGTLRALRRYDVHDQIVLSGAVSFTSAYPIADDLVGVPRPSCLRIGEDGEVVDLSDPDTDPEPGLPRPPGELLGLDTQGQVQRWVSVARVSRGRIQRDRVRGRPTEATGGPFHTAALAAGQGFRAWWRLCADTQDELDGITMTFLEIQEALAAQQTRITVGRARNTAHGGDAELDIDVPVAHPLGLSHRTFSPGDAVWVLLLSPALVTDPLTGDYHPDALGDTVRRRFSDALRVQGMWTSPHLTGGYNAKWRGLVPQEWAAAAGSVIRCEVTADLDQGWLRAAESQPLGDNWVDGYGAFVIIAPPGEFELGEPLLTLDAPVRQATPAAALTAEHHTPTLAAEILDRVTDTLCWQRVNLALPMLVAHSVAGSSLPSASLLGRLRQPLHVAGDPRNSTVASTALSALGELLGRLGTPARNSLDHCMVPGPPRRRALRTWLVEVCGSPSVLFEQDQALATLGREIESAVLGRSGITTGRDWLTNHAAAAVALRFLDEWFRQATHLSKESAS